LDKLFDSILFFGVTMLPHRFTVLQLYIIYLKYYFNTFWMVL